MKIRDLILCSRSKHLCFLGMLIRHIKYKLRGKNIVTDTRTKIYGLKNILMSGRLSVGFVGPEFVSRNDSTQLNIIGKMQSLGQVTIHRGSRISVMNGANLFLTNCFINSNVIIQCEHSIEIGDGSAIGWGTQICDEDYHNIKYANTPPYDTNKQFVQNIKIGSHVLIGNHSFIYKGVSIADGCVIASNSVVKKSFNTPNMLIAGNPAKEIRKIENWT